MARDRPQAQLKHPKRLAHPEQPFIYVGGKDLKAIQKRAWDAGWWPEPKGSGIAWRAPGGVAQIMLHGTSSDRHALANAIARFRKAGLDV